MVKLSYHKNVYRTIGASIGRYIALICIVLLGVLFFVGLKVTTTDMLDSANDFYNEQNLYDYMLVTNIGFDLDSVYDVRESARVYDVEGAYSVDAICFDSDNEEYVARIHSITKDINKLDLVAGKLPENSGECVLDSRYFSEDLIGKVITIKNNNEQDTLDKFVYNHFTVTGLVNSPLYLNYQRGNTSIGNGNVKGFIYVNFEAFSVDYFSCLYVDVENGYEIYSDEYKKLIDDRKPEFESIVDKLGNSRLDAINDKIDSANDEYNAAIDSLSELNTNLLEVEDTLSELRDAVKYAREMLDNTNDLIKKKNDALEQAKKNSNVPLIKQINLEISIFEESLPDLEEQYSTLVKQYEECKVSADTMRIASEELEAELVKYKPFMENSIEEIESNVLTRDDNGGYSSYEDNANIVASIAYIFPLFFGLVAALVCITTMTRMIEEERTQIGVFKALGYSKFRMIYKYLCYSLSAGIIGGVAGFYIGSYVFPTVIWKAYMMMYTYTDKVNIIHDYNLLIVSVLVALLILFMASLFSVLFVLSEQPASLLRPKAPKPGKRVLLERIPFIWNPLPFLQKVSIRNCFRYKKRFFMMIAGIAGCTALLIIGFGIKDSIGSVVDDQYSNVEKYDYLIGIDNQLTDEELSSLKGELNGLTSNYKLIKRNPAECKFANKKKDIVINAGGLTESLSELYSLHDADNKQLSISDSNGILVSKSLANSLDIKMGDEVVICYDSINEFTYHVDGVYENYVNNSIYMSEETFDRDSNMDTHYNCVMALGNGSDIYENSAAIGKLSGVTSCNVVQGSKDYFKQMIQSLNMIVYLVIVCAGALAFVVLYNLDNINIMERVKEIATVKVLGFYKGETAAYVFRENMILSVIGTLVGLPLGYLLHQIVMDKIRIDNVCFRIHVEPKSYIISALITIIFAVLMDLLMRNKINDIDMAESLKSVE